MPAPARRRPPPRGLGHLDVGVQTAPEDIGTPAARFFVAGERDRYERHRGTLEALGGMQWVGSHPAAAAVWDLALFGLWYDAQLGLLRALELTQAAGVDSGSFAEAATAQLGHVVAAATATAEEVARSDHPAGPASLSEHLPLLGQLIAQRQDARLGDGGLADAAELVEALVASGSGGLGLSAVVDDLVEDRGQAGEDQPGL